MLFEPFSMKGLQSKNRIVMAPMCQYAAKEDGMPQPWHRIHYASRAVGQVGMIIAEATAVEPRGRISERDLGLWDDVFIAPYAELIGLCRSQGCKFGIQIAHAGRKADIRKEPIIAPSPLAFNDQYQTPVEMNQGEISGVVKAFGQAARRAVEAGVDFVEIHAAHGYLINQFLSPLTNRRQDEYGINRSLFLRQVLEEVHRFLPPEKPLFVRISAKDYHEDGNEPEDLCRLLEPLKPLFDVLHVSSGGVIDGVVLAAYPGYQVRFSEMVRRHMGCPTIAVGMLETPALAEEILRNGRADLIALGREFLRNPYWPLQAARALGADIQWPKSYERAK
ncbi:MAG: NADH:flavin oxidoreductase/NADH oxidase [Pseudomonadota bacterium]